MIQTREQVIGRALANIRSVNKRLKSIISEMSRLQNQILHASHREHREFYEIKNAPLLKRCLAEKDRLLKDRKRMIDVLSILQANKK